MLEPTDVNPRNSTTMRTSISAGRRPPGPSANERFSCRWRLRGERSPSDGKAIALPRKNRRGAAVIERIQLASNDAGKAGYKGQRCYTREGGPTSIRDHKTQKTLSSVTTHIPRRG